MWFMVVERRLLNRCPPRLIRCGAMVGRGFFAGGTARAARSCGGSGAVGKRPPLCATASKTTCLSLASLRFPHLEDVEACRPGVPCHNFLQRHAWAASKGDESSNWDGSTDGLWDQTRSVL